MKFVIGDVVRPKSGGPEMTVVQYPFKTIDGTEHPETIECEWFNEENRLKHKAFHADEIEKSELADI